MEVHDFGIRSYDLAYALMDGRDAVLIDAGTARRGAGDALLIEPDLEALEAEPAQAPDAHTMTPVSVLRMVKALGGASGRLWIVGCEPGTLDCEEGALGLSDPVQAAVPRAIDLVASLVEKFLNERSAGGGRAARTLSRAGGRRRGVSEMSCCQSQSQSDRQLGRLTRFFLFLVMLAVGGFVVASLPEIRRYIRLSTM